MSLLLMRRRTAVGSVTPPSDWEEQFSLTRDFNDGTPGESTNGEADGFDDAGGGTLYDQTHVFEGANAGKTTITTADTDPPGNGGFGSFGGIINFPSDVGKGSDVWVRARFFFPTGWQFSTPGNGSLKGLRGRNKPGFPGFLEFLHFCDDGEPTAFRSIKEGTAYNWIYYGDPDVMTRGEWHTAVVCAHLDNVRGADGGTSRLRVWWDDALQTDSGAIPTLSNATDLMDALYVFTYWNGTVPQNQSCWIDDITVSAGVGTPSWATDLPDAS